jgi:hypothetical protein
LAKEMLGESKGRVPLNKDASLWNNEMREAIRNKRECYRNLGKCKSSKNFEKYKVARREAKEPVRKARLTIFKDLYEKLDTRDGKKNIYRLARFREKKTRNIGIVKYMKDDDYIVLVRDEKVKERWRTYFDKLFNGNQGQDVSDLAITSEEINRDFIRRI